MRYSTYRLPYKKKFLLFLIVCISVMLIGYIQAVLSVPDQITLIKGKEHIMNFKSPFLVSIKADKEDVIKVNGEFVKKEAVIIDYSYQCLSDPRLMER